jgi:hypothetical protein
MQTSQGYIFCISQHFVTKFCNFTNFNKFFTGIYLFLPRSKISLTWKLSIAKDAARPDRVEGFLRTPLVATLWLMSDHGTQLRWKGQVGGLNPTHNVNFPCGKKPEHPEKTHDFQQSVDWLFSHESVARIEPTISEVKSVCSEDCDTEAPWHNSAGNR